MSVSSCVLAWSKIGGTGASLSGDKLSVSFTEGWQITHSADASDVEIMSAQQYGLPGLGTLKTDTRIPCTGISPPQRLGPVFSIITVTYSGEMTLQPGQDPEQAFNQHPLTMPPDISWDNDTQSAVIDEDFDGNPIATFNGERLNGVTRDISDIVLTVTKNFPNWNPRIIRSYLHATNSDQFATFSAGECRLISCPAQRIYDQTFGFYWKATAKFKFRYPYNTTSDKAWYARVRSEGFRVRTGALISDTEHARTGPKVGGKWIGEKVSSPVGVDATGYQLDEDDSYWKEFKLYDSLPYNALGFNVVI